MGWAERANPRAVRNLKPERGKKWMGIRDHVVQVRNREKKRKKIEERLRRNAEAIRLRNRKIINER